MKNKTKPIFIAITALCIMAGMIGVLANCIGILFAAIREDLGFRAGDLSLYYTLKNIASAFTLTFTVRFALSAKSRLVMTLYGLVASLSMAAMYFFQYLWQWYLAAIVSGIAVGCTFTVIPIVLNNWFRKNNGMVIGLVMSGSGLAGVVFSPLVSKVIVLVGWREAALIMGASAFLLICIPSILFFSPAPAEEGKADERADSTANKAQTSDISAEAVAKLPAWIFPVSLLIVMFPSLQLMFANQITVFATVIGFDITIGGYMTSLAMAGNVSGKFLLGFLADKLDIFRAYFIMIGLAILSMVLFLIAGQGATIALTASLAFGFVYSLYSTGPALLLVKIYGKKEYVKRFSRIQAINTFATAICSSLVAYVYDLTGSFSPVFVVFLLMNLLMIGFLLITRKYLVQKL